MKTVLFGKKIQNIYEVDHKWKEIKADKGEVKTVYTGKPEVTKKQKIQKWTELCSYKGEPRYNLNHSLSNAIVGWVSYPTVNISENESVIIEDEIFRADLNEIHLHTNKITEEIDVNKEDSLSICAEQIKAFNKMMIESNDKLMSYCDLHKLSYEDTDCIELFKLVFPDEEYIIADGIMKVKDKPKVCNSYGHTYMNNNGCILDNNGYILNGTASVSNTYSISKSNSPVVSISC